MYTRSPPIAVAKGNGAPLDLNTDAGEFRQFIIYIGNSLILGNSGATMKVFGVYMDCIMHMMCA